jgi:arsenate reductase-like glutaredoxin family protein
MSARICSREAAMVLYGLSTCDTCKAAQKALQRAGHAVTFRDVRRDPMSSEEIARIVAEFGDRAVNRQSTTYRGFSDFLKASDAGAQISAQPTVMKRPVIVHEGRWYLGWDAGVQAALGA